MLVGLNDVTVRGAKGGSYPVSDFATIPRRPPRSGRCRDRWWRIRFRSVGDAVGDLARNALDGDGDSQAGGRFRYQFQVLSGDVNRDGQVNRADMTQAMASASLSLGEAGYSLANDVDGNGIIDSADFAIIGLQSGTAHAGLDRDKLDAG